MGIAKRLTARSASTSADATSRPPPAACCLPGLSDAGASAGGRPDAIEEPLLYTVQEAARELHIGRTLAYQQAELYLATGGSDGIPTIKIGNCLRVPRPALLTLAYTGRVVSPVELESFVRDLLNRSNRPARIVVRRATRAISGGAVNGASHSADRSPSRARRPLVEPRANSAEQLRLLPPE
jgi:hypothetical protein